MKQWIPLSELRGEEPKMSTWISSALASVLRSKNVRGNWWVEIQFRSLCLRHMYLWLLFKIWNFSNISRYDKEHTIRMESFDWFEINIRLSFIYLLYLLTVSLCMCVYVYVDVCRIYARVRSQCWTSLSITLHLVFETASLTEPMTDWFN